MSICLCVSIDGSNVAFGYVVEGTEVLENIEKCFTVRGKPVSNVQIAAAGVIEL